MNCRALLSIVRKTSVRYDVAAVARRRAFHALASVATTVIARMLPKMSFLFVVGVFVCGGLRAEVSDHRRPNVVYMMLDEIGYFELSSMGHKILKTPNIDRLAWM
jgi:hypothetical protein